MEKWRPMENNDNTMDFLEKKVNESITTLKCKSKKNKINTSVLSIFTVSLSAIITMTLGLDIVGYEQLQKNLAQGFGALLTITNGWTLIFNYNKLWIRQKKTLLSLYQIQTKIGFLKAQNKIEKSQIDNLLTEYLDTWERDGTEWINIQNDRKSNNLDFKE